MVGKTELTKNKNGEKRVKKKENKIKREIDKKGQKRKKTSFTYFSLKLVHCTIHSLCWIIRLISVQSPSSLYFSFPRQQFQYNINTVSLSYSRKL